MKEEKLVLNEMKENKKGRTVALIGIISIIAMVVTMFGFGTTAMADSCYRSSGHSYVYEITVDGQLIKECEYCGDYCNVSSLTYTGSSVNIEKVVYINNDYAWEVSCDYTISYIDRSTGKSTTKLKNVGKYYITVKFDSTRYDSFKKSISVTPKKASFSSVTGETGGIKLKWAKKAAGTTAYQIQYATKSDFSNAKTITIKDTSKTSKEITGLKNLKKYYVRIRTYTTVTVDGETTKLYSSWSTKKSVTTSQNSNKLKSVSYVSKGKIKVSWAKKSNADGYIVQYSTKKSFSKGYTSTVLVGKSSTSKTISALSAKKYYVRVANYIVVNGKKIVSDWSSTKTVTVKQGVSFKTKLNAIKTSTTGKKTILSLTDNSVNISKYSSTYDRVKAIYDWHKKHYDDFSSCYACNKNFGDCLSALFDGVKKYDYFIQLDSGYYKNSDGTNAGHVWCVMYLGGVRYILDPRLEGYAMSYDTTGKRYFGITYSSTVGKKFVKQEGMVYWPSVKKIDGNVCVLNDELTYEEELAALGWYVIY